MFSQFFRKEFGESVQTFDIFILVLHEMNNPIRINGMISFCNCLEVVQPLRQEFIGPRKIGSKIFIVFVTLYVLTHLVHSLNVNLQFAHMSEFFMDQDTKMQNNISIPCQCGTGKRFLALTRTSEGPVGVVVCFSCCWSHAPQACTCSGLDTKTLALTTSYSHDAPGPGSRLV